jgi:hypothetical protein
MKKTSQPSLRSKAKALTSLISDSSDLIFTALISEFMEKNLDQKSITVLIKQYRRQKLIHNGLILDIATEFINNNK